MAKYSQRIYDAVSAADMSMLGVQFGAACIDAGIPVQVVARWMGLTRQGVYYWFTGVTDVADKHREKVARITRIIIRALDDGALPAEDLPAALAAVKKYRGLVQ